MRAGFMKMVVGSAVGAALCVAPAARAEHVLSDYDASRLTLDALTSVPPPVVHHASYHHGHHASSHHAASGNHHALLHRVSYHAHAAKASSHRSAHHAASASHHRHHT